MKVAESITGTWGISPVCLLPQVFARYGLAPERHRGLLGTPPPTEAHVPGAPLALHER